MTSDHPDPVAPPEPTPPGGPGGRQSDLPPAVPPPVEVLAAPSGAATGVPLGTAGTAGVGGTEAVGVGAGDRGRRRSRWILEWVVVLLVALGVAIGVRTFVVQTFFIPSASMEPTLMIGDRIIVDKLSYHLHAVHRGDIVVFGRPPGEQAALNIKDLVKRVIGLPGEWISSSGNTVLINDKPLKEPWLSPGTVLGQPIGRLQIPKGDFFVMGDNRSDSADSRVFGAIPGSLIVGRVVMRIWPLSHMGFF